MKIHDFLNDQSCQIEWLENEKQTLENSGDYFSWWWHEEYKKTGGFGIVVVGLDASMELHLMPDGEVSRHLEALVPKDGAPSPLVSDSLYSKTFEEFRDIYVELRNRTINYS